MSIDLTSITQTVLDQFRSLFTGDSGRLVVVKLQDEFYESLGEVTEGWFIFNDISGDTTRVFIVESDEMTAANFIKASGIGFRSDFDGQPNSNDFEIFKFIAKKKPIGESNRMWEFVAVHTGESETF